MKCGLFVMAKSRTLCDSFNQVLIILELEIKLLLRWLTHDKYLAVESIESQSTVIER